MIKTSCHGIYFKGSTVISFFSLEVNQNVLNCFCSKNKNLTLKRNPINSSLGSFKVHKNILHNMKAILNGDTIHYINTMSNRYFHCFIFSFYKKSSTVLTAMLYCVTEIKYYKTIYHTLKNSKPNKTNFKISSNLSISLPLISNFLHCNFKLF